jgi:SAM-dependent methyltransferase
MEFAWSPQFPRWPDESWANAALETLALKYDTVERHGWYDNLDLTVEQVLGDLQDGETVVDYSGGTGILAQRLLERDPSRQYGVIIADSSPKFLRLALEKFRDEPRIAFRLIRYLREERRLQSLDEVVELEGLGGSVDGLISTNAIHLYYGLVDTLASWRRVMRPGGRVYIQSGNIRNPEAAEGTWIIDETVEHIHRAAMEMVREDSAYTDLRSVLDDAEYMKAHDVLRAKYFLPVRPLTTYTTALEEAQLEITDVTCRSIPARVDEWNAFLSVYHEGVLGWIGGAEKITGTAANAEVVERRKILIRDAMDRVFDGAEVFDANWTYIRARRSE